MTKSYDTGESFKKSEQTLSVARRGQLAIMSYDDYDAAKLTYLTEHCGEM